MAIVESGGSLVNPLTAWRSFNQVLRSLPGRMTISVLLLTVSFGTLLMVSVLYLAAQTYRDQFIDSIRSRAFSLSEIVGHDTTTENIQKLFQGILLSGRIVYAEFLPAPPNSSNLTPVKLRRDNSLTFEEDFMFGAHADNVYYIASPVSASNGATLGQLRLGFDEGLIGEQTDHLIHRSLVFALVYLWALLLASISLALRMSNPIRLLQKASREIASGHLEQELSVSTNVVELAELARDLEHMREELVSRSHKLAISEARYSAILRHAADAMITLDQNARIEDFNMAAEFLFGFKASEVVGGHFSQLIAESNLPPNITVKDWANLCASTTFWGRRNDGSSFHLSLAARSFESGNAALVALVAHDISDRVAYEKEMNDMAFYDTLTQLPNRRLFNKRLQQAIDQVRSSNRMLAVLFLDLDGFKTINDTYGHQAGDLILIAVADRLSSMLRGSDTVARFGGDEFTIILPDINHDFDTRSIAKKIISGFALPFDIAGYGTVTLSTSIGIAVCGADNCDLATVVEYADTAMYFAKNSGKNNYRIYLPEMSTTVSEYIQSRHALEGLE